MPLPFGYRAKDYFFNLTDLSNILNLMFSYLVSVLKRLTKAVHLSADGDHLRLPDVAAGADAGGDVWRRRVHAVHGAAGGVPEEPV